MTTAAWAALGLAAALAAVDWRNAAVGAARARTVSKPLPILALLAVTLLLEPAVAAQRAWWALALAASLAGDLALHLRAERLTFGLAAFLLAHLAYLAGFAALPAAAPWSGLAVGVGVALAVGAPVVRLTRRAEPGMTVAVALYAAVIAALLGAAVAVAEPLAIVGAAAFVASDTLLAVGRFAGRRPWLPPAVMVTYHLAQALLVLSLL